MPLASSDRPFILDIKQLTPYSENSIFDSSQFFATLPFVSHFEFSVI